MLCTNNFVATSICNNLLKNNKQHGGDKCALRLDYFKCAFQFAKISLTMIVYNLHFLHFRWTLCQLLLRNMKLLWWLM